MDLGVSAAQIRALIGMSVEARRYVEAVTAGARHGVTYSVAAGDALAAAGELLDELAHALRRLAAAAPSSRLLVLAAPEVRPGDRLLWEVSFPHRFPAPQVAAVAPVGGGSLVLHFAGPAESWLLPEDATVLVDRPYDDDPGQLGALPPPQPSHGPYLDRLRQATDAYPAPEPDPAPDGELGAEVAGWEGRPDPAPAPPATSPGTHHHLVVPSAGDLLAARAEFTAAGPR